MAFFGKEYTYYKHENFDGFLKYVGIPEDKIQASNSYIAGQKLVKNGDSYTYINNTVDGPREINFKSGVEFDDFLGATKAPVKSTYVVEGNTVTHNIKSDKGTTIFKKEYNGDELVVTITSEGWDGVAKRYYKA